MTSFGSVSRCRSLSVWAQRLGSRHALNRIIVTGVAIRGLSSIPPRLAEKPVKGAFFRTKDNETRKLDGKETLESSKSSIASLRTSPVSLSFTGGATIPVTSQLKIVTPQEDPPRGIWPIFRLMVSGLVGFSSF